MKQWVAISCLSTLIGLTNLSSGTFAQSIQSCNTPVECYENALAVVQELRGEVVRLQEETRDLRAADAAILNESRARVPAGAIMAFDLQHCPTGWVLVPRLGNRFIIGAADALTRGLEGGRSTVTLSVDEMPEHSHGLAQYGVDWDNDKSVALGFAKGRSASTTTWPAGKGKAFNILPPYVAFLYCVKQKY